MVISRTKPVLARGLWAVAWMLLVPLSMSAETQTLEEELRKIPSRELAVLAKREGDAARGAILFFQPYMACAKCHSVGAPQPSLLGPDLATINERTPDANLVEAVLEPSKNIRPGYESVTVTTVAGKTIVGIFVEKTDDQVVIRDVARGGEKLIVPKAEIDEYVGNELSIMPAGQINLLNSRQQFFDLIRYLIEIRDGGALRAAQLQPPPALLTFTLPAYEQQIDHAGLISEWNDDSLKRGEGIYQRVCANCHGTVDKPGSLPTSLRFAEGKFKNGSDPLSIYRTMTHGFGLMAPQTWMVPIQKYDTIHYIREAYLKPLNPTQYAAVDDAYLAKLPKGNTRGPEPSTIVPWSAMDYGPSLAHTYEIPGQERNIAYKAIAVRLDSGAGGVSRGRHWMVFDTDTLRAAAAWNGTGNTNDNFMDWQGIQFNGAHGVHPRIVGQTAFANSTGPGWADPANGDFVDDQRVLGRDGQRYGPLPRAWARYHGHYHHGLQVVLSYSVGTTEILESPRLLPSDGPSRPALFLRTFHLGPRERDLVLQVAEHPSPDAKPVILGKADQSAVRFAPPVAETGDSREPPLEFDGNTYVEIPPGDQFDLTAKDFTIHARVKTKADGTIWSLCQPGPKWIPDGQTFFVRDGRVCFDIGWVGAITGKTKITDGKWHVVAATWQRAERRLRLYVDGQPDGEGALSAKAALPKSVVRIGFTSPDFPRPATFFQGEISEVRFYQRRLTDGLKEFVQPSPDDKSLIAQWRLADLAGTKVTDATPRHFDGEVRRGMAPVSAPGGPVVAGFAPNKTPVEWTSSAGRLRLKIPAGKEPLRFTVWLPSDVSSVRPSDALQDAERLADITIPDAARDLHELTQGGPARWPQKLETPVQQGTDQGPFAIDILTAPELNPWLAQTRFTGLDFFSDGRIAVCTWDGDVWLVEEVPPENKQSNPILRWQRIATGLFQPLGLKIVRERIHVTCRDQLAVLHDLNGDGEIDFYQCLNNDHQVTEHFHEFAMGLQTDADGNFYYAKSGCHGKAAVVPHHGTLLRVSPDGERTDILATGFRAANGVCLNPDGSFVVTDQEGFWNPKNRINWVTVDPGGKPKFYGNMLGYHEVTDSSDEAMEPPLCWITNAFDRSPAELMWVDSDRWGPLNGALLNLSYGCGKVFLVLHEKVHGRMQGGMIELPIPTFPTGVMRGRFHPLDQQLYLCGMFAWAGNATQPGGLYRLRGTGQAMHLPVGLNATKSGLKLTFTEPLDQEQLDRKQVTVKTWSLKRSANYGSKHFDEKTLTVRSVSLSSDAKTLSLDVADLAPAWCMEIAYSLRSASGTPVRGTIHNTIHDLED